MDALKKTLFFRHFGKSLGATRVGRIPYSTDGFAGKIHLVHDIATRVAEDTRDESNPQDNSIDELGSQLRGKLQPASGRPTNPEWVLKRLVPFSSDTWNILGEIADEISTSQRSVSPGQVASEIIDRGLVKLNDDLKKETETTDRFVAKEFSPRWPGFRGKER